MTGVLGPHTEKELELMLSGEKDLAYFCEEEMCSDFLAYVKEGKLNQHLYYYSDMPIIIFSRVGYENKASLLKDSIIASFEAKSLDEQLTQDMLIGALLGYSYEDVIFFIENWKKQKSSESF